MADIVVIDGVRWRREDAERRGLLKKAPAAKSQKPRNKAQTPANKAAEPEDK
ncbi:hypothetical protein [Agromyces larvae]|uniref:Uncharacterized protein n=1 Tax=Agromyces larvae TaxID=2929802 RepID=A0ABY4C665_9MICO|nr:hypothetical protein [Agromyces larvae]UOE45478.1 hypothetical protein MTO99_06895 [Agromyces larvae]